MRERHSITDREREPEGQLLGPGHVDQLRPPGHGGPAETRRHDERYVEFASESVDELAATDEVSAEVDPVVASTLGADPAARPLVCLEEQNIPMAQVPGTNEAGETSTHHDHVVEACLAAG